MTLPFYPFYWGDYSAKTFNLTNTQHGIYLLLLRHIYTDGEPIATVEQCYSIAKATPDQHRDVDFILLRFFTKEDGIWTNKKAENVKKEWEEKHQRRVIAAQKPRKQCSSNALAMPQQPEPEPEPVKERNNLTVISKETRSVSRGTRLPENFTPIPNVIEDARNRGLTDSEIADELDAIKVWAGNAGSRGVKKDWDGFTRIWLRKKAAEKKEKSNGKNSPNTIKGGFDVIDSALKQFAKRELGVRNGDSEADSQDLPRLRQVAS